MIIRQRHTRQYVQIPNALAEDTRLSAEARGVLVSLLSKPENWEVRPKALQKEFRMGRDKVLKIIDELVRAGYARRAQCRDGTGKFAHALYEIYDVPIGDERETEPSQTDQKPLMDSSTTEKPDTETEDAAIYKDINNTQNQENTLSHKPNACASGAGIEKDLKRATLDRLIELWPETEFTKMSRAIVAWRNLSLYEREEALERAVDYIQLTRSSGGDYIIAVQTYLGEKRWKRLPPRESGLIKPG